MPENFVTCPCQHCSEKIEFDASGFAKNETRTVQCPHCSLETIVFVPVSQQSERTSSVHSLAVRGTVLDFSVQTNEGIISGDDGQRYHFQGADWRETGKYPAKGMRVDFSPQAGKATSIYLIHPNASGSPGGSEKRECNRLTAGLLAIFLGCLGIHKFYMGQTQTGCVYILISVLTCGLGAWVMAIVGIVEGIVYLSMTQTEFEQKYILNPPNNVTPLQGLGKVITVPPKKRFLWLIAIFAAIFGLLVILELLHGL
jgi:TM2 domain-containing membrane protein YozV